jgi:indole-3-glycerol phosphate synthase
MPTILENIVAAKREEVAMQKQLVPLEALEEQIASRPVPLNLSGALLGGKIRIIAEIKQASPSRGLLCKNFDAIRLANIYSDNGAAAISVLTDSRFQGKPEHITQIKQAGASKRAPVLRKDFILEPYQVYETRAIGADALLLIASTLSPNRLNELLDISNSLWMQCLVEIHEESDLQMALDASAEIIGINNRDLHTFTTDLKTTERLAPLVPKGKIIVSESGISTQEHLLRLDQLGINGALVGEALLTAEDIAGKLRDLTGDAGPRDLA